MKKTTMFLLSFVSLGLVESVSATSHSQPATTNFTTAQSQEIEKIVADYLTKHPDVITNSFQAAMAKQQKEAIAKMEKAVVENKDKLFKDNSSPVGGNPQGTQSLVVFMDPYCGYCKKFHNEINPLISLNKDVKIIFKDLPIMGEDSIVAVKAMIAAKEQGKYDQLQNAIYSSDKHLTKKQLLKLATSLGIDTKKLESDMKGKTVQAEVDQNLELAKALGINGTPTLIIGETKVQPGYVSAEELNKQLKNPSASADKKDAAGKAS